MSNLPTLRSFSELTTTTSKLDRQVSREIARTRAFGAAITAREAAKVEAIADVTETALIATSNVSAIEALLVTRTPHAEARLRHIADVGTAGMASVVMRMARTI